VNYRLETRGDGSLAATVSLPVSGKLPKELHVTFRAPRGKTIASITVDGRPETPAGINSDTAVIVPGGSLQFEVVARLV
jgi:hypothetical protein